MAASILIITVPKIIELVSNTYDNELVSGTSNNQLISDTYNY